MHDLKRLIPISVSRFGGLRVAVLLLVAFCPLLAGGATADPTPEAQANPLADVRIDAKTMRGNEGFFRVGQCTNGRWWLVDPDGKPFLYRGVCGMNRAGSMGGRRAVPGPYAQAVDRKYGYRESPDRFVEATIERLREWGFNAMGAWTTEEFFDRGMPYTEDLEFAYLGRRINVSGVNVPDVYDPEWIKAVDEHARKICTPRRESRELVGYFTDNELGWGQPGTDHVWGEPLPERGRARFTLLQACLSLPADRPAHEAAWRFIMERHDNSFEKLSKAWDVEIAQRDDVRRLVRAGTSLNSEGYGKDHDAFTADFVGRYVRITSEAIRRHDPNHMILGARFGAPPGEVVLRQFVPPHIDVVSANNYRDYMYERVDIYYRVTQMPILNGEFAWHSGYFTQVPVPPGADREQVLIDHISVAGPRTLEEAFKHPGLVGYTWYRWVHNPRGPFSYGLVHRADDSVNELNIRLLKQVNPRLETIAAQRWPYPLDKNPVP
ncbi:MAG: hypothetical protein JJU36_10845 [Phycisphaeraceae bacterium]|nr:hypothetical protein [Phycisphaeraceae bacterium]